jgi:phosphonate transport system substrate-binding protein
MHSLPSRNLSRHAAVRHLLALAFTFMSTSATVAAPASEKRRTLRIGLTPAFVHDEYGLMEEWRRYLEGKLGRSVEFIQRDSYRETMDLLRLEKLDFAWICDYQSRRGEAFAHQPGL